ncbi:phosphatase PAP2 family protein [Sandaracinobacter neustonicus]|uniref:Phosphatase PAP2 family protein n=1 Tax=Sandaracinobacter neustonicus TaxID=1715348 RepID=A0A501XX75_9SPHN|nr:PEPxxWA-CTERM sorting domain-containing protein [Sandaracinobacter neustonicus]TPE65079.1 phosphatase PAP2 family protein [Sandaracinobacter neustonicus]
MLTRLSTAILLATLATPALAEITIDDDPVLYWNDLMITHVPGGAPVQARIYAIANIAMHDAVNAASGYKNKSYLSGVSGSGGDPRAAASQAAHDVLVALNPANAPTYAAALASSLALIPDGPAKAAGIANGSAHASAILAKRVGDGSAPGAPWVPGSDPGDWQPTPPGNLPAALPHWGDVDPFNLTSGDQFRAGPPPALDSAEYAAAFNEVKEIGSLGSLTRTADQTDSAWFWSSSNATPWMRVGLIVAEDEGLTTLGYARAFALLSTSIADALIAGFDAKYEYDLWRPVTAIRMADIDGNALTEADPSWNSLFPAPNHPSYISTHSTQSGAAATVLASLFGDDQPFTFTIGAYTRSFDSLADAAQDAADSRLWGGIHYRFDNEAGLATGKAVGQWALDGAAFNAVPEPASWAMLVIGFGAIGLVTRRRRLAISTMN